MKSNSTNTIKIHPLRYIWIAAELTFKTNPTLAFSLLFWTLGTGILPAFIATIGASLVDAVINLSTLHYGGCCWKPF